MASERVLEREHMRTINQTVLYSGYVISFGGGKISVHFEGDHTGRGLALLLLLRQHAGVSASETQYMFRSDSQKRDW